MRRVYQQIVARRRHRGHGLHHRRERHRQGGRRAHGARPQPAPQQRLPRRQLRRDLAAPDGERALRPREGQLHRRRPPAPGLLRAHQRRHAVPRRDHRDAARPAGQAAARARDRHLHARRLDPGPGDRRAHHRGDQPQPERGGRARASCARTCSTASTSSRSTCRRCASGPRTSRCSPSTSSTQIGEREGAGQALRAGDARAPAPPTAGRATCASCATSSTAPT